MLPWKPTAVTTELLTGRTNTPREEKLMETDTDQRDEQAHEQARRLHDETCVSGCAFGLGPAWMQFGYDIVDGRITFDDAREVMLRRGLRDG